MAEHGFIHDMLDVKVLLLYIMRRVQYPVNMQRIFEMAYQDDSLNYFDVAQALPQMVDTGHLQRSEHGEYSITPKGIETGEVTEDSLAFPVMQRVKAAVERFNRERRREDFVHIQTIANSKGDCAVVMGLDDEVGNLMTLEMSAPNQRQALILAKAFREKAELLYQMIVTELLDEEDCNAQG